MIRLEDVSKQYLENEESQTKALDGVSMEISKGEFVAIMGPSGCGKSTLLNLIGCIDKPTQGRIYLGDVEVSALSESKRQNERKKYISFVFQNFALMDEYTIYENVEMPLLARSLPRVRRRKIVKNCLSALGVADYEKKRPSQLSGGQQQRAAIARALAANTPILLADEPTGALDRQNGFAVMELLQRIHQKGKTIIMVTHDPEMAAYADRILRMRDGKLL